MPSSCRCRTGFLLFLVVVLLSNISCQETSSSKDPISQIPQGWVSSGGEIFADRTNPWFLQNVPNVNYCVVVDQQTVSLPAARVHELIHLSFAFWKKEFKSFLVNSGKRVINPPEVAIQNFEEVPCTGTEDLKFQFGYGTLSSDQASYLEHQDEYVGIAVRTSYDRVNLRGKGFVYIASDKGPHRTPQGPAYIEAPWAYDGLLFRVLTHELGHVFGLPHIGQGLMSATFPNYILKTGVYMNYTSVDSMGPFFLPQDTYSNCTLSKDAAPDAVTWFGLADTDKCIHIEKIKGKDDGDIEGYTFSSSAAYDGTRTLKGTAIWDNKTNPDIEITLAGQLYLGPEQRVFTDPDSPGSTGIQYIPTSVFLSTTWPLKYVDTSNVARAMRLRLEPNAYQILVINNEMITSLLSYSLNCANLSLLSVCMDQ